LFRAEFQAPSGPSRDLPSALVRIKRALGHLRRFVRNPRVRSENITHFFYRNAHLQGATFSEPNRYPELFAACQLYLAGIPVPTILCFGCATGEETFSLAEYLPNATIIGVDLNRWCLRQASRKNRNPRIRFLHALSPEFAALTNLDAIFAMAVLQRSENRTCTAPVAHSSFLFTKFERQVAELDSKLAPGGLFFIDHADFSFANASTAAQYSPLEFDGNSITHDRPLFGPDNRLVATHYALPRAFQKQQPRTAQTHSHPVQSKVPAARAFSFHAGEASS
jgi:SAM-dependent methyltransferase